MIQMEQRKKEDVGFIIIGLLLPSSLFFAAIKKHRNLIIVLNHL